MKLGQMRSRLRLQVPGIAKTTQISNDDVNTIIYEGVVDVAFELACLPRNMKIDTVAEQQEYNLSSLIPSFLDLDKSGVYWSDGTTWHQLTPTTKKALDEEKYSWRNASSGNPFQYFFEADILTTEPKPSAGGSDLLWVYFYAAPEEPTNDDHYLFHKEGDQSAEVKRYRILDKCIMRYCIWQIHETLSKKDDDAVKDHEGAYYRELARVRRLLNRRRDISHGNRRYRHLHSPRLRGRRVGK